MAARNGQIAKAPIKRPPAGNNKPRGHPRTIKLSQAHREAIKATQILKRLQDFCLADPDFGPSTTMPDGTLRCPTFPIRMTRTQVHVALALLRKVLPDLASVEVTGNPDKPLMVQVVRFSDGEQLEAPRPIIDMGMGKLIEMDATEARVIEIEATGRKNGRKNGHGD